jgi:predicted metal-dependent hydrolase
MAYSQLYNVEGIGVMLFERSRRARRTIITIRPSRGIRVAVPDHISIEAAIEFVYTKESWIKKHLARIAEYEKQKQELNDLFLSIDKKESRKRIIARLRQLARQHKFKYNKVSVRNQRTRWGSCSSRGNISLNRKIVVLPPELADYVILHELVHTRVHNHSKKFWAELDKYVGDGRAKAAGLIEYGLKLL